MALLQVCSVECLVRVLLQGFVLVPAGFLTYWKGRKTGKEIVSFAAPAEVYEYDLAFTLGEPRSCVPFSSLLATAEGVVVSVNEERPGGHNGFLFGSLASFEYPIMVLHALTGLGGMRLGRICRCVLCRV